LCQFFLSVSISGISAEEYIHAHMRRNEKVSFLFKRYLLPVNTNNIKAFNKLNATSATGKTLLKAGTTYILPICVFPFNGKNIRTSLDIDYPLGKKIQKFNEQLYHSGLKNRHYTVDKELWVPVYLITPDDGVKDERARLFWGQGQDKIEPIDRSLNGCVYYLVSGHGGPDPGAIGRYGRYNLYEDEYAYDITLRLARCLLGHAATVYMIVCDPDDGIRDDMILSGDHDEYFWGGKTISRQKNDRLRTQAQIINSLYRKNSHTAKKQRTIIIHVDSRSHLKRIDIFYYYKKGSADSKRLAHTLYNAIDRQYADNQPDRGYGGIVLTRNLYLLNETLPTPVYMELGNLKNRLDQDRFLLQNNRQAVANWLCEALVSESKH
jgi:N-acetylmuramoyl-L-alanine amidase